MAARALEEGKGTILRVEDHLLAVGLARSVPGSSRRNMALATGGHGIAVAVSYSVVMPRLGPGIHEFVDGCCARRRGVRGGSLSLLPRSPQLRVRNSWMA